MRVQQLPSFYQKRLQPNSEIVWWGRRARFEFVEEAGIAAGRLFVVLGGLWIGQSTLLWLFPTGWLELFVAGCCLLACRQAIEEIASWYNEVYVVCRDRNGGGRVYKFHGWLSKKMTSDKITEANPAYTWDEPWFYRLWGKVTGERMMRVDFFSQNHVYISGRKIAPEFVRSIEFIRGAPPQVNDVDVSSMKDLDLLRQAYISGAIDEKLFKDAATHVVLGALMRGR